MKTACGAAILMLLAALALCPLAQAEADEVKEPFTIEPISDEIFERIEAFPKFV